MRTSTLTTLAIALSMSAAATQAATGPLPLINGSVQFDFLSYSGPIAANTLALAGDPASWNEFQYGLINGQRGDIDGNWVPSGYGDFGAVTGTAALSGQSVSLRYAWVTPGSNVENLIEFTPNPSFSVAAGEDFVLGTLHFKNGGWYGGSADGFTDVASRMTFRLRTVTDAGAAYNLTLAGAVTMAVHAPDNNDLNTLAGQQAEADWVYVETTGDLAPPKSLRVYDACCGPAGVGAEGTVDLIGRFGSLHVVGLANAQGGFIVDGVDALPNVPLGPPPPPPPPIPEPGTLALWLAGVGALLLRARRRGAAPLRGQS